MGTDVFLTGLASPLSAEIDSVDGQILPTPNRTRNSQVSHLQLTCVGNRDESSWTVTGHRTSSAPTNEKTPLSKDNGVLDVKWSQPVSRVLSWTVIRLGLQSLAGSSNLPVPNAGRALYHKDNREPIWSCFGWSLPCHELLPAARCALTAPFHPYLIRPKRRPSAVCSLLHLS